MLRNLLYLAMALGAAMPNASASRLHNQTSASNIICYPSFDYLKCPDDVIYTEDEACFGKEYCSIIDHNSVLNAGI